MADQRISALSTAGALTGAEEFPVVQAGETKKCTSDLIKTRICPAVGGLSWSDIGSPHSVTITLQSTTGLDNTRQLDPTTALSGAEIGFDDGGSSDGILRYTGTPTRTVFVTASFSYTATPGNRISACFALDSIPIASTLVVLESNAVGDQPLVQLQGVFEIEEDETIALFIGNLTNTDNLDVYTFNMSAIAI